MRRARPRSECASQGIDAWPHVLRQTLTFSLLPPPPSLVSADRKVRLAQRALCLAVFLGATTFGRMVLAQPAASPLVHEFFEYEIAPSVADDGDDALPRPGAFEAQQAPASGPDVLFTASGMDVLDPDATRGQNGPPGTTAPVSLDRDTETEPRLSYAAVFEPTVAPLKRLSARDAIVDSGLEYTLMVVQAQWREVRVSAAPDAASVDRFRGRFTISGMANEPIPIPSVAPEFWIEDVRTTPRLGVTIVVDSADNYAVVLSREAEVHLEMTVAVPRTYFGGPMPEGRPRPEPEVPARLRQDAAQVLRAIGVADTSSDVAATELLVAWFRSFEARPFPDARRTNNLYLDLALSRIGVCRHRAQTFAMTARAAGLNARYVFNDAHAFVEVELADGWRRFDLGGASEGLDISGASAADQHIPDADPTAPHEPVPSERGEPSEGVQARGEEAARAPSLLTIVQPTGADTPADVRVEGDTQVVTFAPSAPLRPDSRLVLDPTPDRVFRGDRLEVSGRLLDANGRPVAGRMVDVHIGPRDRTALAEPIERIGGAMTDAAGQFSASLPVPSLLPLGEWGLYVSFAGDEDAGPAPPP